MMRTSHPPVRWRRRALAASGALLLGASLMTATAASADDDPRVGLGAGLHDAERAESGVELLESLPLPEGFTINSDLAFTGDHAIVGNYSGFQVYDISDPAAPVLENAFVWVAVGVAAGYGAIGFLDDYLKVRRKRNLGLTASAKFLLQVGVGTAAGSQPSVRLPANAGVCAGRLPSRSSEAPSPRTSASVQASAPSTLTAPNRAATFA